MTLESTPRELTKLCLSIDQNGESFVVFVDAVSPGRRSVMVTDGKNSWTKKIDDEVIKETNYLTKLRDGLLSREVVLSSDAVGSTMVLTIGKEPTSLKIEAEPSVEVTLEDLLFTVAKLCDSQAVEMARLTKEVTRLQQSSSRGASGVDGGLMLLSSDFNPKSKTTAQVRVRRQPGMSVINPNSRKRKTVQGIEFQ